MAIPTVSINESSPAGSDQIALGDNKLREFKTQNREILEIDHVYPSSGQDDDCGKHKQVTLIESADIGSGSEGYTALGAQTIDDKPELVYTDEDDNDVQLTKEGSVCLNQVSLASVSGIMDLIYPVGSVVTLGVSTNPADLFGIGTWTAIAGKVIVGIDGTQTEFDTLNETGGEKTHTLSVDEIPAHTHGINSITENAQGGSGQFSPGAGTSRTSSSVGGGSAHNNLQPYIVKYVWERTA